MAEEVVPEPGSTPGFFQLYTPTDRDLAASLVQRAVMPMITRNSGFDRRLGGPAIGRRVK
jgi:hypothetical protein